MNKDEKKELEETGGATSVDEEMGMRERKLEA